MNNTRLLVAFLCLIAALSSCKKKDDNNTNTAACNGKNLCMKIDGTQLSEDATWKVITNNRRRILWESGSGTNYQNIEFDIYDTSATTGTFTVSAAPAAGQAGFQYYTPTKNIQGTSGTVTLTSATNNTLTGTFVITATDKTSGATVQITEGNFVNVPRQ